MERMSLEHEGKVALLRFNHPEVMNAIGGQMLRDFVEAIEEVKARGTETRCLMITGSGRAFCAGANLQDDDSGKKSKELDHYLKNVISGVPKKLDNFINSNEKSMTYYTGNWASDVADNFTEKQSEKIFKTMSKYMSNNSLQFFQRKNKNIEIGTWSEYGENPPESISSYDYIVIRRASG